METDSLQNAIPHRMLEWRESNNGLCVLLRPKFGRTRVGRWLAEQVRDPHYRIRLDEFGTFVWKACDGETSLQMIAAQLRSQYGPSVEPAERRLALFVRRMLRSKLVELRALETTGGTDRPTGSH
jgi:hypothetical protein